MKESDNSWHSRNEKDRAKKRRFLEWCKENEEDPEDECAWDTFNEIDPDTFWDEMSEEDREGWTDDMNKD